ncbi:MAG: hypothetical protein D3923_05115 [Candidatus Electrothrix sp. AR3]|nr:hypothetical protein [Candidatus Electrothrix sp. AR3]
MYIFLISIALVILHISGQMIRFMSGYNEIDSLAPLFKKGIKKGILLFNLEEEKNIPTLWSSFLAFFGSLLSLICAKQKDSKQTQKYWFGLFFIFTFIAIDEIIELHEATIRPLRDALGTSGLLYYAWTIPFGLLALVIGIIYLRFLFRVDPKIRNLFIFSGVLYVTGAIGLELFEGQIREQGGYMNVSYVTLVTIEEFFEMSGLGLFIYTVLNYIKSSIQTVTIKIYDQNGDSTNRLESQSNQ